MIDHGMWLRRAALVLSLGALGACYFATPDDGDDIIPDASIMPRERDCTDGIDNDGDQLVDCDDKQDCRTPSCPELCDDDVDNNGNGVVDCTDSACYDHPACDETGPECTDGIDNDGNNSVDCADRGCKNTPPCGDDCTNGVDDDGDNEVDCHDADCWYMQVCIEDCDNGKDDDVDGETDCADGYSCSNDPACPENCSNGLDDDSDGDIDCADTYGTNTCTADPVCHEVDAECDDDIDNDGDGATDCQDYECGNTPPCAELCDNDVDDDRDGKVDCADGGYSCSIFFGCDPIDCEDTPPCVETAAECTDGLDNDEDGAIDCADYDCEHHASCPEDCANGIDDDADGRVDCADGRCSTYAGCIESGNCSDGVDNDLDGKTDCRDTSECSTMEPCNEATHCTDQIDNDFDGRIDCEQSSCDMEAACTAAGSCANTITATFGSYQGDTTFGSNDHSGTCEGYSANEVEDVYALTPAQSGVLFVRARGVSDGSNIADVVLHARTSCMGATTELACSDLDSLNHEPERIQLDVTAGTPVYVFVDGGFFADSGFPYSVTFSFATSITETEPNNTISEADPFTSPFVGVLATSYESDYVVVDVAVPGPLVAETTDLGDGTCDSGELDTRVSIYRANSATPLATDDDGGTGTCSRATATVLPGTYYILVEAYGSAPQVPYRLLINAQ